MIYLDQTLWHGLVRWHHNYEKLNFLPVILVADNGWKLSLSVSVSEFKHATVLSSIISCESIPAQAQTLIYEIQN